LPLRNLRAEAAKAQALLLPFPVTRPAPLVQEEEGPQEATEAEEGRQEVVAAVARTSRFLVQPISLPPCRVSCKRWDFSTKARATTAMLRTSLPMKRSRSRSLAE